MENEALQVYKVLKRVMGKPDAKLAMDYVENPNKSIGDTIEVYKAFKKVWCESDTKVIVGYLEQVGNPHKISRDN